MREAPLCAWGALWGVGGAAGGPWSWGPAGGVPEGRLAQDLTRGKGAGGARPRPGLARGAGWLVRAEVDRESEGCARSREGRCAASALCSDLSFRVSKPEQTERRGVAGWASALGRGRVSRSEDLGPPDLSGLSRSPTPWPPADPAAAAAAAAASQRRLPGLARPSIPPVPCPPSRRPGPAAASPVVARGPPAARSQAGVAETLERGTGPVLREGRAGAADHGGRLRCLRPHDHRHQHRLLAVHARAAVQRHQSHGRRRRCPAPWPWRQRAQGSGWPYALGALAHLLPGR